jgi:prepilin peptidase CpaA
MSAPSVIALAVGVAACVTDLRSRRIPNVLTLGSALAAVAYGGVTAGLPGVLSACGGWLLGVACFFLPFALGGLGGGDVKLVGALGAWLGPAATIWVVLYAGVAGGVAAVVVAVARGYLRTALRNVWLLLTHWRVSGIAPLDGLTLTGSRGPRLAYAVPILIGTAMTVWLRS